MTGYILNLTFVYLPVRQLNGQNITAVTGDVYKCHFIKKKGGGAISWLSTHHGAKWDGSGGVVIDSNEVDEESCATNHSWDQECTNKHLLYPSPPCSNTDGTTTRLRKHSRIIKMETLRVIKRLSVFCIKVNYVMYSYVAYEAKHVLLMPT